MKTQTLTKTARRILLAAAVALGVATSVRASTAWIGDGADEYYNTVNNRADGPTGRGIFFVDGVTDQRGVVLNAHNWTVRFDSYMQLAGASMYIGRASRTDPEKIWTFISDSDECGFYLDSGYDMYVGRNADYGDGFLRMLNGKASVRDLYIGSGANANGDLTAINTAITCGNLAMNTADGSTATFYNRGGNLVVTNDLTVQDRGSGEFYMEGGHVIVSNMVRFGEHVVPANGIANLYLNGGVFEAKMFRFHNAADWSTFGYVV